MKFIVSSAQLLKQLQSISGVLNSSNTLPILDNFLFDISGTELYKPYSLQLVIRSGGVFSWRILGLRRY